MKVNLGAVSSSLFLYVLGWLLYTLRVCVVVLFFFCVKSVCLAFGTNGSSNYQ